jgi:hypothetical protein
MGSTKQFWCSGPIAYVQTLSMLGAILIVTANGKRLSAITRVKVSWCAVRHKANLLRYANPLGWTKSPHFLQDCRRWTVRGRGAKRGTR